MIFSILSVGIEAVLSGLYQYNDRYTEPSRRPFELCVHTKLSVIHVGSAMPNGMHPQKSRYQPKNTTSFKPIQLLNSSKGGKRFSLWIQWLGGAECMQTFNRLTIRQ
ncbi:MAG: hypothetical protein ACJAWM_001808 [Sulfitobacter sp.]|jgi:hypothetical protein